MIYLPLIMHGGIIIDDWGDIDINFDCSSLFNTCFLERYSFLFLNLFANRPLAPLPIIVSTILFKTHFSYYLVVNTAFFLLAVAVVSIVINQVVDRIAAITFAFVAPIPLISMPLIVSPINLMDSTCAYLYWAFSLYLLLQFCKKKSWSAYLGSYGLLVCGFFTYEVFLPLLVINALLPFIYANRQQKKEVNSYLIQFIAPLLMVLSIVFLWQKVIGPSFFVFISRLNFEWDRVIPSFMSWLNIFFIDIPDLFKKSRYFLSAITVLESIVFVCCLLMSWIYIKKYPQGHKKFFYYYFFTCVLCFVATSLIFILSGNLATIGGYEARALSSTWIGFAFLISAIVNLFFYFRSSILKLSCSAIVLTLLYYSCLVFLIQRDNYIKSWGAQMHIIEDVLSLSKTHQVKSNAFVIANVPSVLSNNFNNELIFNESWDFPAALRVLSNRFILGGVILDAKHSKFHRLKVEDNVLYAEGYMTFTDFNEAWFYDFDQSSNQGKLSRVKSARDLKQQLEAIGLPQDLGGLGIQSNLMTGETIHFSYNWVRREQYIKHGFAEREGWGVWSEGGEAELLLPMPLDRPKGLRMDVRALVSKAHPEQKVKVTVNGRKQYLFSFNKFNGNFIDIPISKQEADGNKTLMLHFQFENAVSPAELGLGGDERKLAIGFEKAVYY